MPDYAKHYIVSPHDDVRNFFKNAVGMGMHRLSKNKLTLQPVFKDEAQRDAFNQMANDWLSQLGERTTSNQHEFDTLSYLEDRSRSKAPYSWTDFTRVENPSARVYVQGHGEAGDRGIQSDAGEPATAKEVAALLLKMKLPSTSDVRVNSCWSGAGRRYPGNEADWYKRFDEGTLAEVSDPNRSFAAKLHRYLNKSGFQGTVSGYMLPTVQRAQDALRRDGGFGRHMAGAKKDIESNGVSRTVGYVRRRDVRVRVPVPVPAPTLV